MKEKYSYDRRQMPGKKRIIITAVSVLIILCTIVCIIFALKKKNNISDESVSVSITDTKADISSVSDKDISTTAEDTEPVSDTVSAQTDYEKETVITAYKEFLRDFLEENPNASSLGATFNLIFLDDDDIPELAFNEADYHAAGADLYRYNGKEVVEVGHYGSYGAFNFLPREGIIDSAYMGSGDILNTYFRFDGEKATEILFEKRTWKGMRPEYGNDNYESTEDESDDYIYFINDEEVSYDEFNEKSDEKLANYNFQNEVSTSDGSHPLTEDEILNFSIR